MARVVVEIVVDEVSRVEGPVNVLAAFTDLFFGDPAKAAVAADAFRGTIVSLAARTEEL